VKPLSTVLVLTGCSAVAAIHLWLLFASGLDPVSAPVAQLSQVQAGEWHGVALLLFAAAHLGLAALVYRPEGGKLHRIAVALIAIGAVLVVRVALHFANSEGAAIGDSRPLWLLASVIGVAMGLLAPGLWRTRRRAAWFNLGCLAVWVALTPVFLLVPADWNGAYERLVGAVYTVWMIGLALLIGWQPRLTSAPAR